MAFQAPFEIAQSQLYRLRISSVEAREAAGAIYPFFDAGGATRFLVIDTLSAGDAGASGGIWVVGDFPLEIRGQKAIYPRPILNYRALADVEVENLEGLYYFDGPSTLAGQASLPPQSSAALGARNLALRARGRESLRDVFFTLDLRRLTGGVARAGLLLKKRMEPAGLQRFIEESRAAVRA